MSNEKGLLIETNPDLFQKILLNGDTDKRFASLSSLDDLLLCEVIRYGLFNKQEMIGPLANLYRQAMTKIPEEDRQSVYEHVAGFIENTSAVSINALLPFIAEETAPSIVATAVVDYVSLGPLTDNDPMSRVRDVIGMIKKGDMLENEGAAFGALLHLGDSRVCDLLVPLRDSLDRDAMNTAVKCSTGFIHSATVEFYLDWLEGMDGSYEDDAFGIVASGLALLKMKSRTHEVATGYRPFPAHGVTPEQFEASLKLVPLPSYLQGISPRLHALERSEPPPRVMSRVLIEWGLKPLADRAEPAASAGRATTAAARPDNKPSAGRIVDVESEWWDGKGKIFLTWGILNPNGPTLYLLGRREFEGKNRTFVRWLHMLGGCTTYAAEAVDEITYRRLYNDAVSIHEHLVANHEDGLFHVIPSFLIANDGDQILSDMAKRLLASGAASKSDWGRPIAYIRQFGPDFFASAGAELREAFELKLAEARAKGEKPSEAFEFIQSLHGDNPDFRDARIPKWTAAPMTTELLDEWWRIVSPREFQVAAFAALKEMWEGSAAMLSAETGVDVVPWERVSEFVKAYGLNFSK